MSQDIVSVATFAGSTVMIRILFTSMISVIWELFYHSFSYAGMVGQKDPLEFLSQIFYQAIMAFLETAGPMLLITVVLAVIATFAQTRMLVTGEKLKPKLSHISPLNGFKRLFSLRSVVDAVKGLLKIGILLYLIYSCIVSMAQVAANYLHADIMGACAHLFDAIFGMMLQVLLAFVALAALDFLYQWWDFERSLKMSKEEIKEEYKQTEGDPKVKGRIKELQRKMSQARMMQQVPQADVVIRNPTHFAVALRYKPEKDTAPVVLAKGQDIVAARIVRKAEEHSIAVVENVPLARALYADAEINQEIPPALYSAVAEVLVYVFKLDKKL